MTKKFDLNSIVGPIKSLLNPESEIPTVDPSDAIGTKIAQLSLMMEQMGKIQEQQAKDFVIASHLLNDLYKDLQSIKSSPSSALQTPNQVLRRLMNPMKKIRSRGSSSH